jgi:hypothetical protein
MEAVFDSLLPLILDFVPSSPSVPCSCRKIRKEVRNLKLLTGASDRHAAALFSSFPRLRTANLSESGDKISDLTLKALAVTCPMVELLDLGGLPSISAEGIKTLDALPLRYLTLNGCKGVYDLHPTFESIRELRAEGLSIVPESTWDFLLPKMPKLIYLQLGETTVTSATIKLVAQRTLPLTSIDLSWCDSVDDDAIYQLSLHAPALTVCTLQCLNIDDRCIESMAHNCTGLQELNLSRCSGISDLSLHALALHSSVLQVLYISWTTVTTQAVIQLLQACEKLSLLSLQGCKSVTRDVAKHICNARNLSWVDLSWVNDLSPEIVADIARTRSVSFVALDYYGEEVHGGDDGQEVLERQDQQQQGENLQQ